MVPGLGTNTGKFQLSVGWHSAWANRGYFDSRYNDSFTDNWRPRERLSILDVTGRYNVNRRFSVTVTLPIVMNHASMLFPPLGPGRGNRYGMKAYGLGDMTIYTQTWLLNPSKHRYNNVAFGLGMKIPTGNWDVRNILPDETGHNFRSRTLPASMEPGDGGVGIIVGMSGYKTMHYPSRLSGTTFFGNAQYLISPRNTNGTQSIVYGLGVPLSPMFSNVLTNSTTDSFSWQMGAAVKIPGTWQYENLKGLRLRASLGGEGIPTRDLFGRSDGFRQAGWTVLAGPGISYVRKRDMIIADIPFVIARHINPSRTLLPGLPTANGQPGAFNPFRQLGLVPPLAISVRYIRSL